MEQRGEDAEEEHERRRVERPRACFDPGAQFGSDFEADRLAAVRVELRPQMIGWQREKRRSTREPAHPVLETAFQSRTGQPSALPRRVVVVADPQRRRRVRCACVMAIPLRQLSDEQRDRPAVGHQVVERDEQQMPRRIDAEDGRAQRESMFDVEGLGGTASHPGGGVGNVVDVDDVELRQGVEDASRRGSGAERERRSQDDMPARDRLQRAAERVDVQCSA